MFYIVANSSECSRSNYGRIYKSLLLDTRYHCDPLYGKNDREREVRHRVQVEFTVTRRRCLPSVERTA